MYIYTHIYIYSDVMKTIQCVHPPHHMPDMEGQWRSSRIVSVRTNIVYLYNNNNIFCRHQNKFKLKTLASNTADTDIT